MALYLDETVGVTIKVSWKFGNFMNFIRYGRNRSETKITDSAYAFKIDVVCKYGEILRSREVLAHAILILQESDIRLTVRIPDTQKIPTGTQIKMNVASIRAVSKKRGVRTVFQDNSQRKKYVDLSRSHYIKRLFGKYESGNFASMDDGSLTLEFEALVYTTEGRENDKSYGIRLPFESDVLKDFEALLKDRSSADVVFKLIDGGKTFYCHKAILSARSPVFKTMFEVPMKESHENFVEIEDISADAFEHFLSFVYCGRFLNSSWIQSLPQLVYTSDKYLVQSLKDLCDDNLIQSVNCENALAFGKLAERHGLTKAGFAIRKFVAKNAAKLTLDTGFYDEDLYPFRLVSAPKGYNLFYSASNHFE